MVASLNRLLLRWRHRSQGTSDARSAGNAARDAGNWAEAADAYHRHVKTDSDDFGIWVQLGHMLKEARRHDEAADAYATALRLRPDDADLHLNLGHFHKLRQDADRALHHYQASYRIDRNVLAKQEILAMGAPIETPMAGIVPSQGHAVVVGAIDNVTGLGVSGWAVDPNQPRIPAIVDFVRDDGLLITSAVARSLRPDVDAAGMGSVIAGFTTTLPAGKIGRGDVTIHARLRSSGIELHGSPFRIALNDEGLTTPPSVMDARFAMAKAFVVEDGAEIALFLTHAPDGVVKPHVAPYLEALQACGIQILLIVMADRPLLVSERVEAAVAGIMVRDNVGYDFGGWAQAIRLFPEVYDAAVLYLLNDSMFGPNDPAVLGDIIHRVRADPADLVGLTDTHERRWHVQSYFLALKPTVLCSFAFQFFVNDIRPIDDKEAVIDAYETQLTALVERSGLRAKALFVSNDPNNPTMYAWQTLLRDGFPFVKTLLFRETLPRIDIRGWRDTLEDHGFNVPLLEATLRHRGVTGPVDPDFPLLVRAPVVQPRTEGSPPLKVAFYGPWNYDNGLGSASRGIISAIRRTGVRLNLHPIKKPFHVHRPLAPPVDIIDFDGPADIAIVHLNPDSWVLLEAEQRVQIEQAGKRIGYWVWEMGHIPDAWRENFSSVDRIWAPSGYCADLFAAQMQAPVDVVPHTVSLAGTQPSEKMRGRVLASLGLAAGRRIILFVFDGSSYLIRKNPAALVRAFAASGLGARGWTLVLKTKYLFDRKDEGHAFDALARSVSHVLVLNQSLSAKDLGALFATADIYASPHSSEGFGLTIAEAMAAGKAVVATDYSGSRQFLDASCGYPVRAEVYALDADHGHYTKGGEWARIDEQALSAALEAAAAAVERGDRTKPEAAIRRVSEMLSFESVARRITDSFAAVMEPQSSAIPAAAPAEPLGATLRGGVLPETYPLASGIALALLEPGTNSLRAENELTLVPDLEDAWLLFVQKDALLSPAFNLDVQALLAQRRDAAILYGDDVALGEDMLAGQVRLKPAFDISLLIAQDYIGLPLLVRGSALHRLGGLRHGLGDAALYDLVLRAWEHGMPVDRIPKVLMACEAARTTVPAKARKAVIDRMPAFEEYDILPGLTPETLQLARRFETFPDVTLLVPTRRSQDGSGQAHIAILLDGLARTDWPMAHLHVRIADDIPGSADWLSAERPFTVEHVHTARAPGVPFNYAAKMNALWRASRTEHVIFMNDDVRVTDPGWLKALMTFAMDGGVGGVGPRLYYENGTIQHAGVAGGLFGVVAHSWLGRVTCAGTYQDWLLAHREWSMVTGAVFATRRTILEQVDGFEERFTLEYNDLDLCLRIRATGARIVYTPHAEMIHAEKASRGTAPPAGSQSALFLKRWSGWLNDDPAFHPGFRRDRFDLEPRISGLEWFA